MPLNSDIQTRFEAFDGVHNTQNPAALYGPPFTDSAPHGISLAECEGLVAAAPFLAVDHPAGLTRAARQPLPQSAEIAKQRLGLLAGKPLAILVDHDP